MKKTGTLERLIANLKKQEGKHRIRYLVPPMWVTIEGRRLANAEEVVDPYAFFRAHLEDILKVGKETRKGHTCGGSRLEDAVIYNLMVRLSTAYDHDGDGKIGGDHHDVTLNPSGIRETGTFLKSLALLGHIRRLGCNTVYFLPITAIGHDGSKGNLGSPYAIRNPYLIEETLADPLSGMDAESEFLAFTEACHLLGIRVILEFVFRTAAKDCDWIPQHPDWFYWIDERIPDRETGCPDRRKIKSTYGAPVFSRADLALIKGKVNRGERDGLIPPPPSYRHMFKLPPQPGSIVKNQKGQYIGFSIDPQTAQIVRTRIAGAFADWPPDDLQPPWTDVTYLRMYVDENPKSPEFNYIAYNTVRMYDSRLARPELANTPLWDEIRGIIPHFQESFGIDGVMVDMGHAMPPCLMQSIIEDARKKNPDFIFLSENFSVDEKSAAQGYDAVLGYSWAVEHDPKGIAKLVKHLGVDGVPLPLLATSESHNTPRTASRPGGSNNATIAVLLNYFLPQALPFIHSGFEIEETYPVNTGLGFTKEELDYFRGKDLPLFAVHHLDWRKKEDLVEFISRVSALRRSFHFPKIAGQSLRLLHTANPKVFSFVRPGEDRSGNVYLAVLLNLDFERSQEFALKRAELGEGRILDLLSGRLLTGKGNLLRGKLQPGEGMILRIGRE